MGLFNILKKKEQKDFVLKNDEIKKLIDWDEPNGEGCIATDRIMKDGYKVGYMVRNEPLNDMPDSGWWFMAGDEDDNYMSNEDNLKVYNLNTICNYDPDIIPYLHSKVGSKYIRIDDSHFEIDDEIKPIFIAKQDR